MAKKKTVASKGKNQSFFSKAIKIVPLNVLFALFVAFSALIMLKKESARVLGMKTTFFPQENSYEWEGIVREHPDFRDGWLQLCVSYLEEGEKIKAKEALQMAKTLDQNNEKVLLLERLLAE